MIDSADALRLLVAALFLGVGVFKLAPRRGDSAWGDPLEIVHRATMLVALVSAFLTLLSLAAAVSPLLLWAGVGGSLVASVVRLAIQPLLTRNRRARGRAPPNDLSDPTNLPDKPVLGAMVLLMGVAGGAASVRLHLSWMLVPAVIVAMGGWAFMVFSAVRSQLGVKP